jgi:alanyl-tRNA synthetase
MSYDEAIDKGAIGLFGEKYTNNVRVITMGNFSIELCGGTHVNNTGDIGFFAIIHESGVAGGVRRIEAVTGEMAVIRMQKNMAILDKLRDTLKAQSNDIILDKVLLLQEDNKKNNKQIDELTSKLALSNASVMLDKVETLANGVKLLVVEISNTDNKTLLELVDKLKDKLISGIVVIGCNNQNIANLVVGVTKDLIATYKAGTIVSYLANIIDGKGGGRADLAQAGGSNIGKLSQALAMAKVFLDSSIN